MKKDAEFWKGQVAAVKREEIAASVYAKRHTLAVKSLYRWQRKLNATEAVVAEAVEGEKFGALRVAEPPVEPQSCGCTLMLGSSLRIELARLPEPKWLAALVCATQGMR